MDIAAAVKKAAVFGTRYLLQCADYHLGWGLSAPDRVVLALTYRCNCRCLMCERWKLEDHSRELPAGQWMEILEELHEWLGTFRVTFTGGEIFLKSGTYEIIRRAVDLGLPALAISNGKIFASDEHLRRLLDSGLKTICFSIDGADPEVHDRHRGTPGLHAAVADVIRRIKRERPSMSVLAICIIMRETASRLEEFARWAVDVGVDHVLFQAIGPTLARDERQPEWYRSSDLFVTDRESLDRSMRSLLAWNAGTGRIPMETSTLLAMQEYFTRPEEVQVKGRRCMLGQTDLHINPYGVVYMCNVVDTAIGQAGDKPLREIWRGDQARKVREQIRHCRRPCAALCNRSPGLAAKVRGFVREARAGRL